MHNRAKLIRSIEKLFYSGRMVGGLFLFLETKGRFVILLIQRQMVNYFRRLSSQI